MVRVKPAKEDLAAHRFSPDPLRLQVKRGAERYLAQLNGTEPRGLYRIFLGEVEHALLEVVMARAEGNLSRAAKMLGLNRITLTKKVHACGLRKPVSKK